MRVAQVVTLISPDGAYGGPVRVAVNQLTALAAAGHDVTLFATHRGYASPPSEIDGVPLVSYPARTILPKVGFAGLGSPALVARLSRELADFDVVHVHLARDLVTLPAAWVALRKGVPLVVQTHGMIDRSANLLAAPLDAVLTRPVLAAASTAFYLTEQEAVDLREVSGERIQLQQLVNGVPKSHKRALPNEEDTEVLFLARLHPIKRARIFLLAALQLTLEFPQVRFSLVGPDEGTGHEVRQIIEAAHNPNIRWEGPLAPGATLARMAEASIYVLPSIEETFPMTVLEAASIGIPVVISRSCGLAPQVTAFDAGRVFGGSVNELVEVLRPLLADRDSRLATGANALRMSIELFDMERVAATLGETYETARGTSAHRKGIDHHG